uniref:Triadin n=1 Tax=Chelonoidis abingdonii TaxID=106734 RepID=A0A8C0H5F0_CHEAB
MSTTTTVMDNNNGSVLTPPVKVGKKSVTEDIMTTFSSPAAWLLVVALIVTWSAVAIIMFDLVDYKTFAGKILFNISYIYDQNVLYFMYTVYLQMSFSSSAILNLQLRINKDCDWLAIQTSFSSLVFHPQTARTRGPHPP